MPDPEVTIMPPTADPRPEPPPIPDLWAIRYCIWEIGSPRFWQWRLSCTYWSVEAAQIHAERLLRRGYRGVQLVKIKGDDHV